MNEDILTFTDPLTKKRITYTMESIFSIHVKNATRPKRAFKFFTADKIHLALKEFYDLDLPSSYKKYFYHNPNAHHLSRDEGTLIVNLTCHATKGTAYVKTARSLSSHKKKASINLTQTPETLAEKLKAIDFSNFPTIEGNWSRQRLVNALMAYFFALTDESKTDFLKRANMALISEIIASAEEY